MCCGTLSPMNHIGPDDIRIRELVQRWRTRKPRRSSSPPIRIPRGSDRNVHFRLLQPFGIKITRLGYGMPVGGHLELVDEVTLLRALEGRREL